MNFDVKELQNGAVSIGVGTATTIVALHAARKMPAYAGWALLGAGLLGYMVGGEVVKKASIVAASIGSVKALNAIATDGGVPAMSGVKGMINKVVPQLVVSGANG